MGGGRLAEYRIIYSKCNRCGNFYPPKDRQCPYCVQVVGQPDFGTEPLARSRKAKRFVWAACVSFGLALALFTLPLLLAQLDFSGQQAAPLPTVAAEPTATLRPSCRDRYKQFDDLLTKMVKGFAGGGASIEDVQSRPDNDRDGIQYMLVLFKGYDRNGQYRDGRLYLDFKDVTCEVVGYDLVWQ